LEVHSPQGVRGDRAHGPDRGASPAVGLLALAVGHLESFLTPQALDPLVVDHPALPAEPGCGPPPPPPGSGPGEVPQPLAQQLVLLARRGRLDPLGGAVLAHDSTRAAFGDPEPVTQHAHCTPSTVRGQKFPSAISRSIDLSSSASARSFLRRAFSPSSSLSRFASLAFMPPYWATQRCQVDSAICRCRQTSSSSVPPARSLWPSASLRMI